MNVLLVEGNNTISETLSAALSQNYEISSASDADHALDEIKTNKPDIVILDLNLPGGTGLELCSHIRTIGVTAPILVLSGDEQTSTKIELFEAGADDYIVKPFSLGELNAHLKVIARRLESYNILLSNLKSPKLILDSRNKSVIRDGGQSISLRRKEYAILEYLLKNAGETVSRQHLVINAWQQEGDPWSNTIDVHIKNLRDKIDKPFKRKLITTIHGRGYRIESE